MALEGSLRDFDLFSLFNMIKTQGKSGTLVLSRSQEFVKVFFDQGEIIGCDSNQVPVEDRVGAMLVRLGRLSGDELQAMVQRQRQTMKRMGILLLESGRITAEDLQDALFNQAMSVIYRTFRWVEGDYRFDSILPQDLDQEHFPPIPVDTVLMEAARIMDEWPEVQRRLPDPSVTLGQTERARGLRLEIHQDVSALLERGGEMAAANSGLSHEQETVLTYFSEPASIQTVLQISRYDELDTSKTVADLLEMGLLQVTNQVAVQPALSWNVSPAPGRGKVQPMESSFWFWPAVVLFLAGPLALYVPHGRSSLNQGLASLQRADVQVSTDPATAGRQAWAFRLATPSGDTERLARSMGVALAPADPLPDLSRYPDPMKVTGETPKP